MYLFCRTKEKTNGIKRYQNIILNDFDFHEIFIKYYLGNKIIYKKISLPHETKQSIKNFLIENYTKTGLIAAVISPFSVFKAWKIKDEYTKYSENKSLVFVYNEYGKDNYLFFNILGLTSDVIEFNPYVYAQQFELSDNELEMYKDVLRIFSLISYDHSIFLIYYLFSIKRIYFYLFRGKGKTSLLIEFYNHTSLTEGKRQIKVGQEKISAGASNVYRYDDSNFYEKIFLRRYNKYYWRSVKNIKDKLSEIVLNIFNISLDKFLPKMIENLIIKIFQNEAKYLIVYEFKGKIANIKCKSGYKNILLDFDEREYEKKNISYFYYNLFINIFQKIVNSEKIINAICGSPYYSVKEEIKLSRISKIDLHVYRSEVLKVSVLKVSFFIRKEEIKEFFSISGLQDTEFFIKIYNLDVLRYSLESALL